ncbi:DnaJ domain-containing protein [Toxoplasma gondii RUB]|uniref:DnaJ domain-containing protein n=1 Tax=Toxoplasma gondii RUB TaxID=935652 RepID=A0A086LKA2_TOXGO|nr:DnaJ domain-containing protein [Toxoplasma gondii RUB]
MREKMAGGGRVGEAVCYYELLQVEKSSSLEEIKKAFRRQALLHHPDKHADRVEEATRMFQQLQEAYECLSNPQERSWYDAHRQQILGRGKAAEEGAACSRGTSVDLWVFFSPGCFSNFKDGDSESFWKVYGDVFATLTREEEEELRANGADAHLLERVAAIPELGSSTSPWTEVAAFYSFWSSFASLKSFAFADSWKISPQDSRAERRWLQKENEKLRRAKRKQFNDLVQRLVAAVKRRDPRVLQRSKELVRKREG